MDIETIFFLIKIAPWPAGVLISVWVIKLLREINSKQNEYIILIEKTFHEREKTRDQKIKLLDTAHKKEIELIEREKSIFFKAMESEKKNLELQLSNSPSFDHSLTNDLIAELKQDLALVVTKVSNLSLLADDLSHLKDIVSIAGNINRKVNYISNEETIQFSDKENAFPKQEKIDLKNFILEIYTSIYSNSSFSIQLDDSLSQIQPVYFSKSSLYIILIEIFSNVQNHAISDTLRIYSRETSQNTTLVFENVTATRSIDLNEPKYWNTKGYGARESGLSVIKDIMRRYKNKITVTTNEGIFQVKLNFRKNIIT